ncbi:MAG: hypothetical protein Q8P02_04560, partial [Candidatus Micrarchaeota archaeon]|nr:hypothetical protein [Candidatus Micrarchaeota archaeon]
MDAVELTSTFRELAAKGRSASPDEPVDVPDREESRLPVSDSPVQPRSSAQVVEEQFTRLTVETGGKPKAQTRYVEQFVGQKPAKTEQPPVGSKPDADVDSPSAPESNAAQSARTAIMRSGGDITTPTVEHYKTQIRDLRQKAESETDPAKKATVTKTLEEKKTDAIRDLYATTIIDPDADARTLVIQRPDGSLTMVHAPNNPAEIDVPSRVEDQYRTFTQAVKDAGIDDVTVNPSERNVLVDSSARVLEAHGGPQDTVEAFRLLNDLTSGRVIAGGGSVKESRVKTLVKTIIQNIGDNLPADQQALFKSVQDDLYASHTVALKPGGVA